MASRPVYAFYGHHKCATMWWNRIIAGVCRKTGLIFRPVYDERGFGGDLARFLVDQNVDFISHGNAEMGHIAGLGEQKSRVVPA